MIVLALVVVGGVAFWGLVSYARAWPPVKIGDSVEQVLDVMGEPDQRIAPGGRFRYHAHWRASGDFPPGEYEHLKGGRYRPPRRPDEPAIPRYFDHYMPPIREEALWYDFHWSMGAVIYVEDGRVVRVFKGGT